MDAARRGYWSAYGGAPGMAWLLADFARLMRERGIGGAEQRMLFVDNPARLYAFREGRESTTSGGTSR
jgi:predicted metal-dependent phosphotriesterase family hydrolase